MGVDVRPMADVVGHDGEMGAAEFPPQAVVDLHLSESPPRVCACACMPKPSQGKVGEIMGGIVIHIPMD